MPWNQLIELYGDEAADALRAGGLGAEMFLQLADYLTEHEVATLDRIARDNRLAEDEARQYLRVLMDFEDVYGSIVDHNGKATMHYCFAPEMLAQLCQRRKISLARFLKLGGTLGSFMQQVEAYYVSRAMEERTKGPKVSDLKRRYARRIQPVVSPETPLDGWKHPITTHPAWRYLRTAQDLVLLKLDIPREFTDNRLRMVNLGKGQERCTCGRVIRMEDEKAHLVSNAHANAMVRKLYERDGRTVIHCIDCGAARQVHNQDAFQVKRCVACQAKYRRSRFAGRAQLKAVSPSRRVRRSKEVTNTAPDKAKEELITIKCVDCGKPRQIHPQDKFQVKRCVDCQKSHRLLAAKNRRAARSKGKKAKAKPARKARSPAKKAKPKPAAAAEAAPAPQPAPAAPVAEPSATS